MPVKGYKKGYIKDPETGEWIDAREKKAAEQPETVTKSKKQKLVKDETPTLKSVPDDRSYAKVILVWRDDKNRERTTQYVMSNLSVHESVEENFSSSAKKTTRINLTVEGDVLEKT